MIVVQVRPQVPALVNMHAAHPPPLRNPLCALQGSFVQIIGKEQNDEMTVQPWDSKMQQRAAVKATVQI